MALIPAQYAAGTVKSRQHTKITSPAFLDTDHVRFQDDGRLETIPPYAETAIDGISGKCRSIYAQRITGDFQGDCYFFATHSHLYVRKNGVLHNITPLKTSSISISDLISTNYGVLGGGGGAGIVTDDIPADITDDAGAPITDDGGAGTGVISTVSGSKTVTIAWPDHHLLVGDIALISDESLSVGGIAASDINGLRVVTSVAAGSFTFEAATAASATETNGGSSIKVATNILTVVHTAHGLSDGDRVKISGAVDVDGIPAANINKEHIIRNVSANAYDIQVSTYATSLATGGGTGAVYYAQITAGNAAQVSAKGKGAGLRGAGIRGVGQYSASGLFVYPRIWSFDAFGNNVVMCPGDYAAGDGQKIYLWDGNTDSAPTVLENAPTDCNWVFVVNNSVVALCGRTLKIAALGDETGWSGLSYREKTLERVDLLYAGYRHADKNGVIFHSGGAVLLRYTGDADIWDISDIYEDDALVSPLSCARVGTALIWRGKHGFYGYDGGLVQKIVNKQNQAWIDTNASTSKAWHGFAVADATNAEVYFHFATGGDDEPGDYVLYSPAQESFTLGKMIRTAGQRPGALREVFYAIDGDNAVYQHFTTGDSNFSWFAETAFFMDGGNGDYRLVIDEIRPDSNQSGNITLEIITRDYAQASDTSFGTYDITSATTVLSVRAAGRLIKFRFSGTGAMTLGFWIVNLRQMGRR